MKNASEQATSAFLAFEKEYEKLLAARPDIAARVDPTYLVIDVSAGIPGFVRGAIYLQNELI